MGSNLGAGDAIKHKTRKTGVPAAWLVFARPLPSLSYYLLKRKS